MCAGLAFFRMISFMNIFENARLRASDVEETLSISLSFFNTLAALFPKRPRSSHGRVACTDA
jgi:hypothetical protein